MGLLDGLQVDDGPVAVELRLTTPTYMMLQAFLDQFEMHAGSLPSLCSVALETDDVLQWDSSMMSNEVMQCRQEYLDGLNRQYGADVGF